MDETTKTNTPPTPSAEKKRGGCLKSLLIFVAGMTVAAMAMFGHQYVTAMMANTRCGFTLRDFSFAFFNTKAFRTPGDEFPDNLVELVISKPELKQCPACDAPYVYSPVSPAGQRAKQGTAQSRQDHMFVMWCPAPCHTGKRNFLATDLSVLGCSDLEVSWYYQKLVSDLTPEEREKEKTYRSAHGFTPLP